MIPALDSLKSLIKNKSYHIDHPLFRLHYQITTCGLMGFCLILTAKIMFGDTIDCKTRSIPRDPFYDNLCYAQGTSTTYAFPEEYNGISPTRYLYSGIMVPLDSKEPLEVATYYHHYYQYIPIILFLQAVFFYIPHYLWKSWENGIVSSICKQLHDNRFAPTEYIESNYHIIDYLKKCFSIHKSLVYKYYICHILLMFNLVGQVVILDMIFNYKFTTYGIDAFRFIFINKDIHGLRSEVDEDNLDINSPMDFVFPKVTACTVSTLSVVGGSPDIHQFLCVLPLNILHDKFFLVLWYWFAILGAFTVLQIVFDISYTILPPLRKYLFQRRFGPYLSKDNHHSTSLSELFLLDLIGNNSDKFAFSALLRKLNKEDWPISSENESVTASWV